MSHYKQVKHSVNWLSDIDGLSVAQAIEYLKALNNDNYILNYWLDGDTHGIDLGSNILENVPMNRQEIEKQINIYYDKRIAHYDSSYRNARRGEDDDRITSLDKIVKELEDKRTKSLSEINVNE